MTEDQVMAFLAFAKGNADLQQKLQGASDVNELVAIAANAGFQLSAEDFKRAENVANEMELEFIAGGAGTGVTMFCDSEEADVCAK